jgi:hypothetical protein
MSPSVVLSRKLLIHRETNPYKQEVTGSSPALPTRPAFRTDEHGRIKGPVTVKAGNCGEASDNQRQHQANQVFHLSSHRTVVHRLINKRSKVRRSSTDRLIKDTLD